MSEIVSIPYTFPKSHSSGSSWLGMRLKVTYNDAEPGQPTNYVPVNLTGATAQAAFRDSPLSGKIYCLYDSENTVPHKQVQFDLTGDANTIILPARIITATGIQRLYMDIRVVLGAGAGSNEGLVIFPFQGIMPITQTSTR